MAAPAGRAAGPSAPGCRYATTTIEQLAYRSATASASVRRPAWAAEAECRMMLLLLADEAIKLLRLSFRSCRPLRPSVSIL